MHRHTQSYYMRATFRSEVCMSLLRTDGLVETMENGTKSRTFPPAMQPQAELALQRIHKCSETFVQKQSDDSYPVVWRHDCPQDGFCFGTQTSWRCQVCGEPGCSVDDGETRGCGRKCQVWNCSYSVHYRCRLILPAEENKCRKNSVTTK